MKIVENPYEQMDDLGGFPPIFGNTQMFQKFRMLGFLKECSWCDVKFREKIRGRPRCSMVFLCRCRGSKSLGQKNKGLEILPSAKEF